MLPVTGMTAIAETGRQSIYRRFVRREIFGIHCVIAGFWALFLAVLLQATGAAANPSILLAAAGANPNLKAQILAQDEVGECACGPCSIFNAFQFGDAGLNRLASRLPGDAPADKVRCLIRMYGEKPSVISRDEPRYLAQGGMWDADLVPFANDWLKDSGAPPVTGERLTPRWNETAGEHLQRVYNQLSHSLAAGFPPVVNLQSYVARRNLFHHYWKWMDGHFVTVVGVQHTLPGDASRFSMWVADSQTGKMLEVTVSADGNRPSSTMAESRAQRSGRESAHPAGNGPYLTIQSPRLETILEGNVTNQTICVLQYMVHR